MKRLVPALALYFGNGWTGSSGVVRWDSASITVRTLLKSVGIPRDAITGVEVRRFWGLVAAPAVRIRWASRDGRSSTVTLVLLWGLMSFLDAFAPAISRDLRLRCRIKLAQAIWWTGLVTFAVAFFVFRAEWSGAVIAAIVLCNHLLLSGASTASIDARMEC